MFIVGPFPMALAIASTTLSELHKQEFDAIRRRFVMNATIWNRHARPCPYCGRAKPNKGTKTCDGCGAPL